MNTFLWQTYQRLLQNTTLQHKRYLYDHFDHQQRLMGIIGPRGVGKTTLMLQWIKGHLKQSEEAFYFSADNTYFNEASLLNFVNDLYLQRGIRHVFIDEIHKYPNWSQEIKNLYDAFPELHIIFSGSSSIDLVTGTYDLSRRAHLLHLPGMSFREYLNIKLNQSIKPVSLSHLLENHIAVAHSLGNIATIMQHFNEYLAFGYYPIIFEGRDTLYDTLNQVIDKTIYEDIARFYDLKTHNLQHFRRILNFLSSIPPGQVSTNNIARHLQIDNKTVDHYLTLLTKTGMTKMLYPAAHGRQTLTRPSKVYLDNTTLLHTTNTLLATEVDQGSLRELAFLQFIQGAQLQVFFPKVGDFQIGDDLFEIGGKNKTGQQLKHEKQPQYLIKADIPLGFHNEIPLYLFGLLY